MLAENAVEEALVEEQAAGEKGKNEPSVVVLCEGRKSILEREEGGFLDDCLHC